MAVLAEVAPRGDAPRAALALLLGEDPGTWLRAVLPTVLLVRPRLRGGFAHTQALAALLTAPTEVRRSLERDTDRRQRRFVFDVTVAQGRLRLDELVGVVETADDVLIRRRAAEAACREAVWTRQPTAGNC